jgi:hypothetical protein
MVKTRSKSSTERLCPAQKANENPIKHTEAKVQHKTEPKTTGYKALQNASN